MANGTADDLPEADWGWSDGADGGGGTPGGSSGSSGGGGGSSGGGGGGNGPSGGPAPSLSEILDKMDNQSYVDYLKQKNPYFAKIMMAKKDGQSKTAARRSSFAKAAKVYNNLANKVGPNNNSFNTYYNTDYPAYASLYSDGLNVLTNAITPVTQWEPYNLSGTRGYINLSKGLSYIHQYKLGNLPQEEMDRWKDGLRIADVFTFNADDKYVKKDPNGHPIVSITWDVGGTDVKLTLKITNEIINSIKMYDGKKDVGILVNVNMYSDIALRLGLVEFQSAWKYQNFKKRVFYQNTWMRKPKDIKIKSK
jgi:hypothetical protein